MINRNLSSRRAAGTATLHAAATAAATNTSLAGHRCHVAAATNASMARGFS